jgi:hypothetical protein
MKKNTILFYLMLVLTTSIASAQTFNTHANLDLSTSIVGVWTHANLSPDINTIAKPEWSGGYTIDINYKTIERFWYNINPVNFIEISNSPNSGLKRKVEWRKFTFEEDSKVVRLFCIVHVYEDSAGTYGDEINSKEIKPYEVILVASTDPVNPATGSLLINGIDPATHQTVSNPITEFQFFEMIVNTQSIQIATFISQIIQARASAGKFD